MTKCLTSLVLKHVMLLAALLALGGGIHGAHAQQFGKNKAQFYRFNWQMLQTKHFDIYYYQGGEALAEYAGANIETIYADVSSIVGHKVSMRIPIILHNTPAQFQQTNVIPYPIPEAVGGFTEMFKNRIVIPFNGSYRAFYHVLKHELVHGVMFDYFAHGPRGQRAMMALPLWLNEGLAEFVSLGGWNAESEMYMMDAASFGYLQSPVNDFYGFMAYRGGQSFLVFLEYTYGKGTITKLLKSLQQGMRVEQAFLEVTNVNLEENGELWLREMRYMYWPELGVRQYGKSIARQLTKHHRDHSNFNTAPSISPDGKSIAFFSDKGPWEALYVMDVETEKIIAKVVESVSEIAYESFHSFTSNINWSPDSKYLAMVAKNKGRDRIHLLEVQTGKIKAILAPNVEGIISPSFFPDGERLIFTGIKNGQANLYTMALQDTQAQPITKDNFYDVGAVVSPNGTYIAFESDRNLPRDSMPWKVHSDIYVMNILSGSTRKVTHSPRSSSHPAWASDSLLFFESMHSGIPNIYAKNIFTDSVWIITNVLSAAQRPTLSLDASKMAFQLFEGGGFDVMLMQNPLHKKQGSAPPTTRFVRYQDSDTASFFRPVQFENLSSFRDSAYHDSVQKAREQKLLDNKRFAKREEQRRLDSLQLVTTQDSLQKRRDSLLFLMDSADYLHADNTFKKRKYTPQWSLDRAIALAGWNNIDGVGGQGVLTFTDLMGDQSIDFWFYSDGGSLSNISGFLGYSYLPYRPDFHINAYHYRRSSYNLVQETNYLDSANGQGVAYPVQDTVVVSQPLSLDSLTQVYPLQKKLLVPYADRYYGALLSVSYPFSVFMRLQMNLDFSMRQRTYDAFKVLYEIDSALYRLDYPTWPVQTRNTVGANVSWVLDNVGWGITGPIQGNRMQVSAMTLLPGVLQKEVGYYGGEFDLRKYLRFSKKYTLALRAAAGASNPWPGTQNPHSYLIGGDEMNLNWRFNYDNYSRSMDDVFFSSWNTRSGATATMILEGAVWVCSIWNLDTPLFKNLPLLGPFLFLLGTLTAYFLQTMEVPGMGI
jgi:hypothetical protein